MRDTLPLLFTFVSLTAILSPVHADEELYRDAIRPLLHEKCGSCHGALRQESSLRLDAGKFIHRGGDSGPVLQPGSVRESALLQRVRSSDPDERMPPADAGAPLKDAEIALLSQWIESGAAYPADEIIPGGPEDHWSWKRPERPAIPQEQDFFPSANPIDRLVARHWQENELRPVTQAPPLVRLRRLHLDLTGLPPTLEEQRAWESDTSPEAWRKVVDRVLSEPSHGERWARHWMDVWRYSDWDGYKQEVRGSQRHIWHWRDWIVESLNADVGYDQMIRAMLAADELYPDDFQALRATGFLVRNFHNSNRDIWLDSTVEHTAKAFLATTVNCARCHDHKYDPISQREYYAFRAIFEPYHVRTERLPGQSDLRKSGLPRAYDKDLSAKTYLYIGGNEKLRDEENPLTPALPEFLSAGLNVQSQSLPPVASFPHLREFIRTEEFAAAESELREVTAARDRLTASREAAVGASAAEDAADRDMQLAALRVDAAQLALDSLRSRWEADVRKATQPDDADNDRLARAAAKAERLARQAAARLAVREKQDQIELLEEPDAAKRAAQLKSLNAELQKREQSLAEATAACELTDGKYSAVGPTYPATTTGRRTALAAALTAPENPLVARVAVNYIWMHHFGEPLVPSVFDFGMRASPPPMQDVLDFLATELIASDWSMKHIHRLILNSRLWQLSSSGTTAQAAANIERDPENQFLWRAHVRRMESEAVRDSMLAIAGSLDPTRGGPEIPYSEGETTCRRSLYYQHAYEKQMTMMVTFDAAGPQECYRRSTSIVPQQALALANSPLTRQQSLQLERRISTEHPALSSAEFVDVAFRFVLARDCTDAERQACLEFLSSQELLFADPQRLTPFTTQEDAGELKASTRSRVGLIRVLFNHNDFVTVR